MSHAPAGDNVKKRLASAMHGKAVPEHVRRVAVMLHRNQGHHHFSAGESTGRPDVRDHERHVLVAPCTLTVDAQGFGVLQHRVAFVHNISQGGAGLLTTEPRQASDLVEITITMPDQELYLCGVVAFCRYIEGNVHEVGVQLHQRGDEPILPSLVALSDKDTPAWFAAARNTLCERGGEKRKSA